MGKRKVLSEEELKQLVLPAKWQCLGVVEKMLGLDRLRVRCFDGYTRLCRIRGKLRRKIWMKEGDIVLVEPWCVQEKSRGDVVWRYTDSQVEWLKKNGYIPS